MSVKSAFIVTTASGFEGEGRREIQGLISTLRVRKMFFKGTLLVESDRDEGEVIAALRDAETTYLGRVFPVDSEVRISRGRESLGVIYDAVRGLGKLRADETFRVHCRRRGSHDFNSRDVEVTVGRSLEEDPGATADLTDPEKAVVVQIFQDIAYVGVTGSENLVVKEVRRFRKYARGERPFTRAEFKLREALEAFGVKIKDDFEVLDVGAAPGGWIKVLAGMAGRVVAVDPADLHPSIGEMRNVTHLRCRAEEMPGDIGAFDLVTNDMNVSPEESAEIMNGLAGLLREGGSAIMTVKFVTRERRRHVREARKILEAEYGDFRVKRLPHNRNETTLFMRKKG